MSPLQFCLLTTFYPPFNFGGDGIDVERTARALVKRGHRVRVVHDVDAYEWLSGRSLPDPPANQNGVEVQSLRSRLGVLSPLLVHQTGRPVLHRPALSRVFREQSFDVVVFNNVSLVGGPGLLSFGGDALKVYVAHEHWLICPTHVLWRFNREPCESRSCARCVLTYRRPPQLWRYTGALERQLSQVDLFIARSEFSRQKHKEFGFPRPMEVLPYFLPGLPPAEQEGPSTASPHDRPYFLFVGRLARIKGLDSVIPVFAKYPEADFLVIGEGDEERALRALASPLVNVKFLGWKSNQDLGRYYRHALAVVAPSRGYETFGIVLIEAFRYGTPVIARRIGPFPEIVQQAGGGYLFSTEQELLESMSRLQHDPDQRAKLGANAYRACRQHWSEEAVIGRFLNLVAAARAARVSRT
jgi:glycosyltransferase involved in cell wall biosynthesis